MKITYDPPKRAIAWKERGLRFEDAVIVFAGLAYTFEDRRHDYGERRFLSIGFLNNRMVVVGWTPRDDARHVFMMRKANDREQKKYGSIFTQARLE